MSRHPEVKWAEREDKVYLTIQLPDAKNPKVNVDPEGAFIFSATGGAGDRAYELKLDLFDKVNVEESKINYGVRSIFCVLEKAEQKWWSKLLRGAGKPPPYVKIDWDKWADEDEDNGPADLDLGGMDFSKFSGSDKFEDSDDDDDDDDDDLEVSKPEAGAPKVEDDKTEGDAAEKSEASTA